MRRISTGHEGERAEFIAGNASGIETEGGSKLLEADPAACARIVSSRIAKWLEREVLGPQDVLVDVPHLIQRCPYLLDGDISDLGTWNAALFDEQVDQCYRPAGCVVYGRHGRGDQRCGGRASKQMRPCERREENSTSLRSQTSFF